MISKNNIVIYSLIAISLIILFMIMKRQYKREKMDNIMPESAAEACRKISSRAEEIEAEYGGVSEIMKNVPFVSLFNPNNYKAGDTSSKDTMRNIINSSISQEDITKIANECKPISTSVQRNVINIDLSGCKYCENNPCEVSVTNVTQENIDIVEQTCMMETAIEALMKNTKSIDSQALAQTLQKTKDLLSGKAESSKDNCNVLNSSMSSKSYLESISACAQAASVDQENKIDAGCAASIDVSNIIQANRAKKLQECIINATVDKQLVAEEEAKLKGSSESTQESAGLNPLVFGGSSSVSCIFSIIVGVVLVMYKDVAAQAVEKY